MTYLTANYCVPKVTPKSLFPFTYILGQLQFLDSLGHGKKSVVKATIKSKEAHCLLEHIGKTLNVNQNIFDEITKFTMKFIYGDKLNKTLAAARASKWNSMKTKSTQRIPPDQDSHDIHVKRVNYQAKVLLNYDKPVESWLDFG